MFCCAVYIEKQQYFAYEYRTVVNVYLLRNCVEHYHFRKSWLHIVPRTPASGLHFSWVRRSTADLQLISNVTLRQQSPMNTSALPHAHLSYYPPTSSGVTCIPGFDVTLEFHNSLGRVRLGPLFYAAVAVVATEFTREAMPYRP